MRISRSESPTSASTPGSRSRLLPWLGATRPKTLLVGVSPVLVGTAWAVHDGVFAAGPAVAALLGALLIQVGTNLSNDYFDHRRGADTGARLGPVRASAAGLLRPASVFAAAMACFGAAAIVGLYLVWSAGWPVLVIGIASLASGYAYTGGPYPLGYHGWGEVFAFLFFGIVAVAGTYFVQARNWPVPVAVLLAGVAMGALAAAVLVVNNLRDLDTDRAAGKRTLAVRIGRRATQVEYVLLLLLAWLVPLALWASAGPMASLALLTIPLGAYTSWRIWRFRDPRELNRILALTGLLMLLFALLLSAAVL